MQFKGKLAYIALSCVLLLSSVVLLINVGAQVPQQVQIVFMSSRDGNYEIYVMDADGKNPRNLTNHPGYDGFPSWSPDGQRIAFYSKRDGNWEIYVMDADGKNQHNLTKHHADDQSPSWSPDGRKIAFRSNRDGDYEIYVMDVDEKNGVWIVKNLRNLTNNPMYDGAPSWSPDGQRIAFVSDRDILVNWNWQDEIYVMDADGKNPRNLTNHPPGYDSSPSWSPDGQRIAFESHRDGDMEIYVMDADGKNQRNLTKHAAGDYYPSWSPDGQKIAFNSDRDGNNEIYVMDADGKNQRNLTKHATDDHYPDWFDPAIGHPVSPAGKLRILWGWIKQNSK